MGEWMSIERWPDCTTLERPGIVFELANAEGLSLFTRCGPLPTPPFDWKSAPIRFRAVEEKPAVRSGPLPGLAPR